MRRVIAGFRHKFKDWAVATVNAGTHGSKWNLFPISNSYKALSDLFRVQVGVPVPSMVC